MDILCTQCPRSCGAVRSDYGGAGVCQCGTMPVLARAAAHYWEEPCISGERGSGTVFFSGCALKCVFCQNQKISREGFGRAVTPARLREIFLELADAGVHNINLVNPTHFSEGILAALEGGLPVPVVYNTGGYDKVETLRKFSGKVQIYLPDMKYAPKDIAAKYAAAPDYPQVAQAAILEMFRQVGPYEMGSDGLLKKGVVIRHLVLPGNLENRRRVIDWVAETFSPGEVLFSLMSQYTPCGDLERFPELRGRLTPEEYNAVLDYMGSAGIEDGFFQELSSAKEEYIPPFDLTGVENR